MDQFHLLRPAWLLALIPLLLLLAMWHLKRKRGANLSAVCDPRLLPHLLIGPRGKSAFNHNLLVAVGGLLAITALTGPSWEKLEQPVYRQQSSLVILLDLSSSMNGTDIKPSRLARARFKLMDILKRRSEGQTALIVYAAQPFIVTPLTDDNATISSLVNSLATEIMPSQGSRPDLAMQRGIELLKQATAADGHLLFITDGINDDALNAMLQTHSSHYPVHVLGIGTTEGSPIPLVTGGFVQDRNGDIVIDRLNEQRLLKLVSAGGGGYHRLTHDDRDIDYLLAALSTAGPLEQTAETTLTSDSWFDEGPWLLLPLLPLAALAFRRGYLVLFPLLLLPLPEPVQALEWSDLWLTPDQQAARSFAAGDPHQAARRFRNARWRSAAHYQAGEYQQSLDALSESESADGYYNRGNAFARLGRLQEAIQAYEKSLSLNPGDEDAEYNLVLIRNLMQQQQQGDSQSNRDDGQERKQESGAQQRSGNQQRDTGRGSAGESQAAHEDGSSGQRDQSEQDASPFDETNNGKQREPDKDHPVNPDSETAEEDREERNQSPVGNQADDGERVREDELTRQWLRQIPDDPGGLLKRKFLFQYQQQFQGRAEKQPW